MFGNGAEPRHTALSLECRRSDHYPTPGHLPLVLLTTAYNNLGSRWVIAPLSMVTITGAGIFYAWLRDTTHSLWPAAIAHAVENTVLGLLAAAALPTAAVPMAYLAGEGGVVTAQASTAVEVTTLLHALRNVWRTGAPTAVG